MTFILFILVFGVVVISHEFGHFLLAKANGIHVVEFSVGMGPKLLGFTKGDTKYVLRLLPIGGACMFEGEDGLNEKEGGDTAGSFQHANVWSKISTVFAGPFFNFILAFVVALIMVQLIVIREPIVSEVTEGSPAWEAGLRGGDRIVAMGRDKIYLYDEVSLFIAMNKGDKMDLTYERNGIRYNTSLEPRFSAEYNRYMIGIANKDFAEPKGFEYVKYAWYEVRYGVINVYKSLGMLVRGRVSRKDVAGPVGLAVNVVGKVYEETKESAMDVLVNMLNIVMLLSVNLGILNLLPIPALDGGRLVFLLIEVVRGKPIPPEKEGMVHFVGMMFFFGLMIFVFFNDLVNIFG